MAWILYEKEMMINKIKRFKSTLPFLSTRAEIIIGNRLKKNYRINSVPVLMENVKDSHCKYHPCFYY